jgi:hypothetical protein
VTDRALSATGMFALFSWLVGFSGLAFDGVPPALVIGVTALAGTTVIGLAVWMNLARSWRTCKIESTPTKYVVVSAVLMLLGTGVVGFWVGRPMFLAFAPWLPLAMGTLAGLNFRKIQRTALGLREKRFY